MKLESLPEGFGELKNLTKLDMDYCKAMVSLPERFGELPSLTTLRLSTGLADKDATYVILSKILTLTSLDLSYVEIQSLSKGFGELKNLQTLNLNWCKCKKLESLPVGFGDLKNLETLDLENCEKLVSLPKGFGKLENLQKLNLSYRAMLMRILRLGKTIVTGSTAPVLGLVLLRVSQSPMADRS